MKVQIYDPYKYFYSYVVAVPVRITQALGEGITVGTLLAQLMWHWKENGDREFYLPLEVLCDQTGLTRHELGNARERLKNLGIAEGRYVEDDQRVYWSLDIKQLETLCNVYLESEDGQAELAARQARHRRWKLAGGRGGVMRQSQNPGPPHPNSGTPPPEFGTGVPEFGTPNIVVIEEQRKDLGKEAAGGAASSPKTVGHTINERHSSGSDRVLTIHRARDIWNEFAKRNTLFEAYTQDPTKIRGKFLVQLKDGIKDRTEDELRQALEVAYVQDWVFERNLSTFPWVVTHMGDFLSGVYGSKGAREYTTDELHPELKFKAIPGPDPEMLRKLTEMRRRADGGDKS